MKINRKSLLEFYDTRQKCNGAGTHVSAITGFLGEDIVLGLLLNYFNSIGTNAEILSYTCSSGKKKGPRLDGWVIQKSCNDENLYQIEIKNWAASSIGGKEVGKSKRIKTVFDLAQYNYNFYFNTSFNQKKIFKVLNEMKKPEKYKNLTPIPLVALWSPIGVSEELPPFFNTKVDGYESSFYVFSSSLYLNTLNDDYVDLHMPRTEQRLSLMSRLIPIQ